MQVLGENFCKHLDFHRLRIYRKTGYKCGVLYDVAWLKNIIPYNFNPSKALPITSIPREKIDVILQYVNKT